jgi:hypothetical protein
VKAAMRARSRLSLQTSVPMVAIRTPSLPPAST